MAPSKVLASQRRRAKPRPNGRGPDRGNKKVNNGAYKKKDRGGARGTGTAETGRGGTKLGSDLHPNSNKHSKRWDANSGRNRYPLKLVPLG